MKVMTKIVNDGRCVPWFSDHQRDKMDNECWDVNRILEAEKQTCKTCGRRLDSIGNCYECDYQGNFNDRYGGD